jgi:hypothetical protein
MLKDNSRLMFAMLDQIAKGERSAALELALLIIEAQKDNMDELTTEFDRLYGAARVLSFKLPDGSRLSTFDAHLGDLEEQIERLRPLFEQVVRRRG